MPEQGGPETGQSNQWERDKAVCMRQGGGGAGGGVTNSSTK